MSKYTTELRYICELEAGLMESKGVSGVEEIITQAAPKIFNFPWPIFDEDYRLSLERKILLSYYTREICEETYGLWKLRLDAKLNEIMPYYNQLYKSQLIEFDPTHDVDYTKTYTKKGDGTETKSGTETTSGTGKVETSGSAGVKSSDTGTIKTDTNITDTHTGSGSNTKNGESSATSSGSSSSYDYESDTPQGSIGNDAWLAYLSKINKNIGSTSGNSSGTETVTDSRSDSATDTTKGANTETRELAGTRDTTTKETKDSTNSGTKETSGNNTIKNVEEYSEHVVGKMGGSNYAAMIKQLRESFINIDKQIIDALNDLFFCLW